ncbi:MAG: hypothetical protein RLZZ232_603 [Planctomycetota bacterium]|jgi:biotin carboxylase
MKQLLIAGGSHSDVPMILAAQRLGFRVITTGNRPMDYGHQYSDLYVPCDYSCPDALLAVCRRHALQAIVPCCNDFAALSCAYVAEKLGLPGHDPLVTTEILHHKDRWRAFAETRPIPGPRAIGCSTFAAAYEAAKSLRLPLIIKPVDLTGGKGITRVGTPGEVDTAIRSAFSVSRAGRIVVEEFIEGTRHGFTCILRNQDVAFYFTDDEHYHLSPYLVSGASAPSSLTSGTVAELIGVSQFIARDLNLTDGIFHVQLICRPDQTPAIIEICRRPPGDLYVDLVRHATGVPYAEWIIRSFVGLPLDDITQSPVRQFVTRHCLMADRAGRFLGFEFDKVIAEKITEQITLVSPGAEVIAPESQKLGIAFVHYDSERDFRGTAPILQSKLRAAIEP